MEKELSAYKINEGLQYLAPGWNLGLVDGLKIHEAFFGNYGMAPVKTTNEYDIWSWKSILGKKNFNSRKIYFRKIFTYKHKGKYTWFIQLKN